MSMLPFDLSADAQVVFETSGAHSHFFGYYDRSPFDRSGQRLLSHRVEFDGRPVESGDVAEVGLFHLDDGEFRSLGETTAFNWQQGSLLQWLPPGFDQRLAYNIIEEGNARSVIVDLDADNRTILESPVYDVHPSGSSALSVNFERLAHTRQSYSYRGLELGEWAVPIHDRDGIFLNDLETGERELLVGTRQVCDFEPGPTPEDCDHWLEHPTWNPSGTRFAFHHRWSDGRGGFKSRLLTANPDGTDLFMFPDTGLYSHLDWKNDQELTVWGIKPSSYQATEQFIRDNALLDALIRPAYRFVRDNLVGRELDRVLPERGYLQYQDGDDDPTVLASDQLDVDGHFTWSDDERWLLTDTYPLENDLQHLRLYDDKSEELHELGAFPSTFAHEPYKCDLHPRWDRQERRIAVDSAHRDRRQLVVIDQDLI